ncbi:MAG: hypothetical protein O7J95_07220, partial [Planctomycetota bacterium]|nr:hypothetical protein [Planctomycetota bacterium]
MAFTIRDIQLRVRETEPGRMVFALGKAAGEAKRLTNPLAHVRLVLRDASGKETFGTSGDRLSVRWLDKRPGRTRGAKLRDLVDLIYRAREIWLAERSFSSPFEKWLSAHRKILRAGRAAGQEDLTSSFASALLERALLDAVCRLAGRSFFEMARGDRLGFLPARIHPELDGVRPGEYLPAQPLTRLNIRHTVGLADPLTADDVPAEKRLDDGLPETLEEYIRRDGIRYFKVKVS